MTDKCPKFVDAGSKASEFSEEVSFAHREWYQRTKLEKKAKLATDEEGFKPQAIFENRTVGEAGVGNILEEGQPTAASSSFASHEDKDPRVIRGSVSSSGSSNRGSQNC